MKHLLLLFSLFIASNKAFADPNFRTFHPQMNHGATHANCKEHGACRTWGVYLYTDFLEGPFESEEISREFKLREGIQYQEKYKAAGYVTMQLANGQNGFYIEWTILERRDVDPNSQGPGFLRFVQDERDYIEGPFSSEKNVKTHLNIRKDQGILYQENYRAMDYFEVDGMFSTSYFILWKN